MKTTVNASIGGISFTLEDDAFSLLSKYLDDVNLRLGKDRVAQETVNDIEIRVAELLSEKVQTGQVVTVEMLQPILSQIGDPSEFTEEDLEAQSGAPHQKRLYRNPDDSILSGVCSGLAAYFNVDPLVFRIIFIALIFFRGFGILLYLALWIAMPKAKTPFQKMEMRGDNRTLEELGKKVREEYSETAKRFKNSNARGALNKLFNLFGEVMVYLLKAFLIAVKAISLAIGVILIVSMLLFFIALVGITFFGTYYTETASAFGGFGLSLGEIISSMFEISSSYWVTIPVFLIFAIPIVALIYAGIRILFRFKAKDAALGIVAAVLWAAAVVSLSLTILFQVRSLSIKDEVRTKVEIASTLGESKTISCRSFSYFSDSSSTKELASIFDIKIIDVNGRKQLSGKPTLYIEKTSDEYPRFEVTRKSRGVNHMAARNNARDITYSITSSDTVVTLDPLFIVPHSSKWKSQSVSVILYLPEGYGVYLDESLLPILNSYQPYSNYWPDEMVGKTWVMTSNGLRLKR